MYLGLESMSCPYHPHECICKNQLEEYSAAFTSNPHPEDFFLWCLSNWLPPAYWQNVERASDQKEYASQYDLFTRKQAFLEAI